MTSPEAAPAHAAASPLLIQGLRFLEAGDAAGADFLLQTYLGQTPDDPDGHNLAGLAKRHLGDDAAARSHLERAVALRPAEPLYAANLAMLLSDTGAGDEALTVVENGLRLVSGQPDLLLIRVQVLQRLGRGADAMAGAQMAVAFNPRHARSRHALGLALFRSGDIAAAAENFTVAVEIDPDYAEAWLNRGVALKEIGDLATAEASYRKALSLAPQDPTIHNNLGNLLSNAGRGDEAIAAFLQALVLDPAYADAKANLGLAMREAGDVDGAVAVLAQAVSEHPTHVVLWNAYGNTLRQADRLDEAVAALEKAVALDPNHSEAHNNLGLALALQFKLDEAAEHLGRAAALKPQVAVISNNYGALLLRLFRFESAVKALENAIARDPNYDEALTNLGIAYYMLGQADEAIGVYKRVISRNPDSSFARYSLGVAYLEDQRLTEAEVEIKRALELDPGNALAQNTLGVLLLDQHRIKDACAAMRAAADINTASAPVFYSNYAFASLYEADTSNSEIFEIHKEFGRRYAMTVPDVSRPHANVRDPNRRLRLAYLSPDFRAHSVAYFFEALLEKHDRRQFEVLLYSDTTRKDKVTDCMRAAADGWIESGGLTTEVLANRLREDKIDILVNLGGHTSSNRLPACALGPAPVQIEYLGYPDTSGVPAMKYRLSDKRADPTNEWCTEELVHLPHCFHLYRPNGAAPAVAPSPAARKGYVTFASFNVLPKVTDRVIAAWAQILKQVPGSRFYLKCKQLREEPVRNYVRGIFADHGVSADRIDMDAFVPSVADHLGKYANVDLALDPFPYNGTTTSCEAMWMGVPVLTMRGSNHRGRVGYSLLHAVGLADAFVADNLEDYIARAVVFGRDPAPLATVRAGLRERMAASPLRDEIGFTRTLEATYRDLWRKWCEGPETFMFKPPTVLRAEDSIQGVLVKTL